MQAFVLVAVLMSSSCFAASIDKKKFKVLNDDSSSSIEVEHNEIPTKHQSQIRFFVSITRRPPPVRVLRPGQVVALRCEAMAMPAPTIRWYRNNMPTDLHDLESNEAPLNNPQSVARVVSTLIVKQAGRKDEYTCLVTSGQKVAKSSSFVYSKNGSNDLSERSRLEPLAPRIVGYYKAYIDTIGHNMVLPCRAKGHPRPHITWTYNKGEAINDSRMKILRSGDLSITSVLWSDVGDYTCHATNVHGSQNITTFLYPTKAG